MLYRVLHTLARYLYGIALTLDGENGNIELSAYHLQLLDSGGTVNVAGDEQRALSLLLVQTGELCLREWSFLRPADRSS